MKFWKNKSFQFFIGSLIIGIILGLRLRYREPKVIDFTFDYLKLSLYCWLLALNILRVVLLLKKLVFPLKQGFFSRVREEIEFIDNLCKIIPDSIYQFYDVMLKNTPYSAQIVFFIGHMLLKFERFLPYFIWIFVILLPFFVSTILFIDVIIFKKYYYFYKILFLLLIPLIIRAFMMILKDHSTRNIEIIKENVVVKETKVNNGHSTLYHLSKHKKDKKKPIDIDYYREHLYYFATLLTDIDFFEELLSSRKAQIIRLLTYTIHIVVWSNCLYHVFLNMIL